MTEHPHGPFKVGSLATPVYLPSFLFAAGQGAVIPVIALFALDLGAGAALAGVIVALRGLGTMVFDIPAGVLVSRIGEKRSMLLAASVLAVVAVAISLRPSLAVYAVLVVLMGASWSVWLIGRLSFSAEASPTTHRGRVMSTIGGVTRIGWFVGPLVGGLVVARYGLTAAFFAQAVLTLAALLALASIDGRVAKATAQERPSVTEILRDHRRAVATAGLVVVALQILRSSREAIIPLWGDSIGISASQISLIFAAAVALEILMFYPAGRVMDRRGRKWTAVPCLVIFSIGLALVPLTRGIVGLTLVALVIGFANGLGSGLNMTLGSDLSPEVGRSTFLGLWRTIGDVGTTSGPIIVAFVASVATIGAAAVVVGGIGVFGAVVLSRAVPETLRAGTASS